MKAPHRIFNLHEVADYLHISRPEVEGLVRRNGIPFEKRGEKLIFRRNQIDAWAAKRLVGAKDKEKARELMAQREAAKPHNLSKGHGIIPDLLKKECIRPALKSRTKVAILSDMVKLADSTGLVRDPEQLLKSLREREQMCSTALAGGIALLHPRHHLPQMFSDSFIVLGRTSRAIPFGSPDGMQTDLFFLVCCQEDKIHLHVLARLCVLCYQTSMLLDLREAQTGDQMYDILIQAEQEVIKHL